MNARIMLLIVAAGGLAIYVAVRPQADPNLQQEEELSPETLKQREFDKLLWLRDLPGEDVEADIDVAVSVVGGVGSNQLAFDFTEAHGYYVETFEVDFWYKPTPDTLREDSRLQIHQYFDDFLKANETRRLCLEVVKAELDRVEGGMGDDTNWGVELSRYGRARASNPDVFPGQNKDDSCQ